MIKCKLLRSRPAKLTDADFYRFLPFVQIPDCICTNFEIYLFEILLDVEKLAGQIDWGRLLLIFAIFSNTRLYLFKYHIVFVQIYTCLKNNLMLRSRPAKLTDADFYRFLPSPHSPAMGAPAHHVRTNQTLVQIVNYFCRLFFKSFFSSNWQIYLFGLQNVFLQVIE